MCLAFCHVPSVLEVNTWAMVKRRFNSVKRTACKRVVGESQTCLLIEAALFPLVCTNGSVTHAGGAVAEEPELGQRK